MKKPELEPVKAVLLAALMGQEIHLVIRPPMRIGKVQYVAHKSYFCTRSEAEAEFRFCSSTDGAAIHSYSHVEVLEAAR